MAALFLGRLLKTPVVSTGIARATARGFHLGDPKLRIISFKLADIGEGIAEAKVLEWHVKPGDQVEQFDMICGVQSDKATVDITSRYDGEVVKLYYEVDDYAKVGQPLLDIDVSDDVEDDQPVEEPVVVDVPKVEAEEKKAEAKSEVPQQPPQQSQQSQKPPQKPPQKPAGTGGKVKTTPAVRHWAKEHNIDLTKVTGTGKEGRILKDDIIHYLDARNQPESAPVSPVTPQATDPSTPTKELPTRTPVVPAGEDVVVPVRGLRQAMTKTMTAALKIPHFGYCDEIEMDALMETRNEMKPIVEQYGVRLSFMPFFLKAASLALREYPILNSHVNEDCTAFTQKASHNIGVAMDTPEGLMVPNIKDVQGKSILEIAQDLTELQALGSAGKLTMAHMTGGTFTLSNIGVVGGTYASPVLASPEVVIGALGKTQRVPRFVGNSNDVVAVNLLNISWSADHRIVDGVTMAKFSNQWKTYLENPKLMLLELK